ncbi:MAG: HlyD family efflux transporter periplasmic adaptor subunit [Methylococcaceae bacterium]
MEHFAQNWLAIQCKLITDCCCALLLIIEPDSKNLQPLAHWPPASKEPFQLLTIAQLSLKNSAPVINQQVLASEQQTYDYIAAPIFIASQLVGVIAVKTSAQSEQQQQHILALLEQGQSWLELATAKPQADFYTTVVSLVAACLDQDRYNEALIALITALTQQFQCERVSIGELKHQHSEIVALSNCAKFDAKANLIRSLGYAMDEAVDQDSIIVYPPTAMLSNIITRAHWELARKYGTGSICTLPLSYRNSIFAVITLERSEEQPFTPETVRLLEQTLALLSPFLQLKRVDEQHLLAKIGSDFKKKLARHFGLKQLGLKLSAMSISLLLVAASMLNGDFKIHANAVLEGKVQRVVAAPMQGFILTAEARAGDTLKKGAMMAAMDDSDLKLEAVKLDSQQQQALREYREAISGRDLVKVSVLSAQLEQVKAQLQLISEQLQRTVIVAPFDGVVIEGDLSQALGSPVERGDSLFKMAPLEGYRIVLKVNERLISYVHSGQTGTLALSSLPEQPIPLTVEKITAGARAEDGSNIFRVEASLSTHADLLRPGMAGVAKINAGQKPYLWIWTHELKDWVSLWFWSWYP